MKELLERIGQLESAVEALTKKLERLAGQEKANTEITDEHLKLFHRTQETHHIAFCNIFQRIRNLESKLFPDLAADLTQIKSIFRKDDDKVRNPLDYRKPKTE